MKTTLLTAAGSAAAGPALESLHALGHRVIGCDIYPKEWNLTSCLVDGFFQAIPAADSAAYTAQLLEAVEREQADYLIPLTDVEVDALCTERDAFAALGCTLCTPEPAAVRLCRDKLAMTHALAADGRYTTIPTRSPYGWVPEEADFPLLLKPLSGRSSQGQAIIHNRDAFSSALSMREDYIAQPFLPGDVYTVDVARDRFGNVQALVRQELLRTVSGLGTTVRIVPGHPLEDTCAGIAALADIVGVVNMEFIHHQEAFYFLEVNPRFSGGIGFSILAGVDFPALALRCQDGFPIGSRPDAQKMTATRHMQIVRTCDG